MSRRYRKRKVARNNDQSYDRVFKERGVNSISQYATPSTPGPNDRQFDRIEYYEYAWSVGDRFWKLAHYIYGDKNLWYIIARYNNVPTEAHVEVGQIIRIPKDANLAKKILGV